MVDIGQKHANIRFMNDSKALYRRFGELVRKHRLEAGLKQEEVADRVGLARTSITNIEKGRQKVLLHQLYDLASAVSTTPASLLPEPVHSDRSAELEQMLSKLPGAKDTTDDERDWIKRVIEHPRKN